jgi:hypothetical protein
MDHYSNVIVQEDIKVWLAVDWDHAGDCHGASSGERRWSGWVRNWLDDNMLAELRVQ